MRNDKLSINKQLQREVFWVIFITIFYLLGWLIFAYIPSDHKGLLGFPLWFELSCLYFPILFIFTIYWVVRLVFKHINF